MSMKEALQKEEADLVIEKLGIYDIVMSLENSDVKWFKDPNYLASRYLLPDTYYPLKGYNNCSDYYQQILIESESASFDHFNRGDRGEKNNPNLPYAFSKIYIQKFITPNDWGLDVNRPRILRNFPKMDYNYWDYRDAWYYVFFYDNPQRKHTWFVRISPEIFQHDLPNWLYHW